MRSNLLGVKEKDNASKIDTRYYAKYVLREGSMQEKRELLRNLKNKIVVKDRKVDCAIDAQ